MMFTEVYDNYTIKINLKTQTPVIFVFVFAALLFSYLFPCMCM